MAMENEAGVAFNSGKNSGAGTGNMDQETRPSYSIPGILHFIQHEWTRFEMERAQWEVERAELQARIAFLQGERRGQENLKKDLVRRIKMLEYALKQERQKYHKLRYGTDLKLPDIKDDSSEEAQEPLPNEVSAKTHSLTFNYRQGRQILRQYLQEIGYTDKVLELRSARVKVLLGLGGDEANGPSGDSADIIPASAPPAKIKSGSTDAQGGPIFLDGMDDRPANEKPIPVRRAPSPPLTTGKKSHRQKASEDDTREEAPDRDSNNTALDKFDFLQSEGRDVVDAMDEDLDDGGNADDELDERDDEDRRTVKKAKQDVSDGFVRLPDQGQVFGRKKSTQLQQAVDIPNDIMMPPEDPEVLKEFDFLSQEEQRASLGEDGTGGPDGTQDEWHVDQGKLQKRIELYKNDLKARGAKGKKRPNRSDRSALQSMLASLNGEEDIPPPPSVPAPPVPAGQNVRGNADDLPLGDVVLPSSNYASRNVSRGQIKQGGNVPASDAMEVALRLGDLADLTVEAEAGPLSVDLSTKDDIRKTWSPKYTLRSHFDGVRSLSFHPFESALITASEDHTLKLWSLQRNAQAKKGNISDIEPVYTFRGHSGPVLCTILNSNGSLCYSGGIDATIQCWNVPPLTLDLFGPYDPTTVGETLVAHTEAVWDLALQIESDRLLSCAADGTCRLWNSSLRSPLLCTYTAESDIGQPSSVSFINTEPGQMAASYTSSECLVFDLETAKTIVKLDSAKTYNGTPSTQINKVISHPTLPVLITAHEDRHIRFFDINTGKQIHTMVAHLDAVTSLSVDPTGLYILSGSHDGSIRLWNMENKTCIQEITAHRKKFDEAVLDVAFHPSQPFIASAGADAVAKVFV